MARTKQTAGKSTGGKAPKIASNADLEREDDRVANMGNRPSTEEQIIMMKSQAAHPNEGHASKRQRLSSSPENHGDNLVVTGSSLLSSPSLLNDDGRVRTASSMSLALLAAANESSISPFPSIKPCSSSESSAEHDKRHGTSTFKDADKNLNQTENVEDRWGEDVDDVDDFEDDFGETDFGHDYAAAADDINLSTTIISLDLPGFQSAKQVLEMLPSSSSEGEEVVANGEEYSGKRIGDRHVAMAVTSDDVSEPTLPTMPTAVLLNILKYVDGDPDESGRYNHYHPDILAFERTCRSFRHLLKDDAIWGTLFPDVFRGEDFDHPPTMREKAFLCVSFRRIRLYQRSDDNILLEYLGGAVGVRRIVGLLLDEMKPVGFLPPLFLRGDAIMYLVEVIQGHIIARLQKVNLLVIKSLSPGDGYPEVREKDLCLLDELTLYDGSFRQHSSLGVIECNFLEHCRCSIAKNKHSCTRVCRPSTAGEYADWTWPDHNCASEEIFGAEERRKMVRALAYRAGIVKMSGSAFSIVATEILHHMAVIVSYAYDTFASDPPVMQFEDGDDSNADYDSDQSETILVDVRGTRRLNYFANFHPPGRQTELVVIPRQIRDAAVMIGMKPLLGFGLFGAEWASINDDGRDESSNDDEIFPWYEIDEEVENAENQYYPPEEIESEDGRVGEGEGAIVPAPGPGEQPLIAGEQPLPDPDVDDESVLSLLSDSFSLDS